MVNDEAQEAQVGLHTRATRATLVPEIVARADRDHPDDVPCVIAMSLVDGHPEYLRWIIAETTAAADASSHSQ